TDSPPPWPPPAVPIGSPARALRRGWLSRLSPCARPPPAPSPPPPVRAPPGAAPPPGSSTPSAPPPARPPPPRPSPRRPAPARPPPRRSQRIARQSATAGMALSLVAMCLATGGLLAPALGALLQEGIDLAVIVNALRAPRDRAPRLRLDPADLHRW